MRRHPDANTVEVGAGLLALALLAFAPASDAQQACATPQDVLAIEDAGLKQAIKKQLELAQDAAVTCGDVERLRELAARDSNIVSLRGLEHAAQLERLDCGKNRIVDLAPLSGLKRLTELRIERNNVADLTPLLRNTFLRTGFRLYVNGNCLNVSDGSTARTAIDALVTRGVAVDSRGNPRADCPK